VEAEQRCSRVGSVHYFPEEKSQDRQLVVDGRDSNIDGFERRIRARQCSRSDVSDMRHVFGSTIVQDKMPGSIISSCAKQEKADSAYVDKCRHSVESPADLSPKVL